MNLPVAPPIRRVLHQYLKLLLPALLSLLLVLGSWVTSRGDNVDGSVPIEMLVTGRLESGQTAAWSFYVESLPWEPLFFLYLPAVMGSSSGNGPSQGRTQLMTMMVAPAATANIRLTVQDDSGNVIVEDYDQAPAGDVETIADLALPSRASYQVLISADPPQATDYALMVLSEVSYDFRFQGTLVSGESESGAIALDSDDFWFFLAAAGDTLSMQVTPLDGTDPYVELYGPAAQILETIDAGSGGEPERLDDYSILETGMYGIRVGEFDFLPMTYQIVVQIE